MRRVIVSALAALAFATGAMAQSYDLYYVLPGEAGSKGIEAGIAAADVGSIGDVGVVNLGGKYSLSDQIEVGAQRRPQHPVHHHCWRQVQHG